MPFHEWKKGKGNKEMKNPLPTPIYCIHLIKYNNVQDEKENRQVDWEDGKTRSGRRNERESPDRHHPERMASMAWNRLILPTHPIKIKEDSSLDPFSLKICLSCLIAGLVVGKWWSEGETLSVPNTLTRGSIAGDEKAPLKGYKRGGDLPLDQPFDRMAQLNIRN